MKAYPAYKPSGVEWFDIVPEGWEVKALRRAITLNPSKSELGALDKETEVTFLPMEAVGENGELDLTRTRPMGEVEAGYTYFRDGDMTFAKITPCFENGKRALMRGLLGGVGFGTTELTVLRAIPEAVRPEFLFWLISAPQFRHLGEAHMYGAGGQKRVPDDFVREFPAAFPPLPEQQAIAGFLDVEVGKIDALVAEQRRLIALLAEKRQAVISHAVTQGLNPSAPRKPSGIDWLGDIPQGWDVVRLRRVLARIEQGFSPECFAYPAEAGEWGVLKTGCVNRGIYTEAENKALPPEITPRPEAEVKMGDLLMSRASGSPELIGSVALVEETRGRIMLSDKIFRLRTNAKVAADFLKWAMGSREMRSQIVNAISGGEGMANNLPQADIKNFLLALPPPAEQAEIVAYLDAQTTQLDALTSTSDSVISLLQERRAALISAAVTGKIDVRDRAALFDQAL